MSNHSVNPGGLQEAKEYMMEKEIPQLFESMMTALMYKKPEDHLEFLETCLHKAKKDSKVRWHSFIEPLPPIPQSSGKIQTEATIGSTSDVDIEQTNVHKAQHGLEIDNQNETNALTEKVFQDHINEINDLGKDEDEEAASTEQPPVLDKDENVVEEDKKERPWYVDYTEKEIDTSIIQEKPIVFVLGGPGSGKGTQCKKIVEKYGFLHLSAGDLLRNEVSKGSEIGTKIDQIIKEGQLVPQDVTICLLKEAMVEQPESKGYLIDGFPREIKQGKQFERQVAFAKLILNYDCPDDVLTERLLARGQHSGRVDDNIDSIKKRLTLFHEKTAPVIEFYSDVVATIGADREIEEVFQDTCKAIDGLSNEKEVEGELQITKPIVFVLGGPGSGKEKQCEMLAQRYSLMHVSLDGLLNEEKEKGGEIGEIIKNLSESKQPIPQDIVINLLKKQLADNADANGYLLDGFPRSQEEAICFELEVCPVSFVVYFQCDNDYLMKRCKEDGYSGTEEELKNELELFHSKMTPMFMKYPDKLKIINAMFREMHVFNETCEFIDAVITGQKPPPSKVTGEDEITPEREQEIESAVQDIADYNGIEADSNEKEAEKKGEKVEGEEGSVEVEETKTGDSGNKKHLYKELLKNKKIVLVAGMPGCGKSTQCKKIAEIFGYSHISKDVLIKEVTAGTDRGLMIAQMLKNKENVPDKLAFDILGDAMLEMDECKGFLLEGYPMNMEQSKAFEDEFKAVDFVVHFICSEDVSKERFLSRGQPDDTDETYQQRMEIFTSQIIPLIEAKKDVLREITVSGDIEEIFVEASKHFQEEVVEKQLEKQEEKQEEYQEEKKEETAVEAEVEKPKEETQVETEVEKPKEETQVETEIEKQKEETKVETQEEISVEKQEENSAEKEEDKVEKEEESKAENQEETKAENQEETKAENQEGIKVDTPEETNMAPVDLSSKNIIFVVGGPGSGKGTQCAKIVEKYGFCHLSTGDLLRAEVKSGSKRADELKEIMAKGELVPLETTLALLREAMLKETEAKGFLIDGYPRDVSQGEKFEESVGKCKFILYFHCTNEVMTERLLGRAKTSGRVDDNEETIKLRLKTFEGQTLPVLDRFSDKVKKIDAMRNVNDIFVDVCKELDTL